MAFKQNPFTRSKEGPVWAVQPLGHEQGRSLHGTQSRLKEDTDLGGVCEGCGEGWCGGWCGGAGDSLLLRRFASGSRLRDRGVSGPCWCLWVCWRLRHSGPLWRPGGPSRQSPRRSQPIWPWWSKPMGSHFQVGAPPIVDYFSGDWDARWGYGILTHGHLDMGVVPFNTFGRLFWAE